MIFEKPYQVTYLKAGNIINPELFINEEYLLQEPTGAVFDKGDLMRQRIKVFELVNSILDEGEYIVIVEVYVDPYHSERHGPLRSRGYFMISSLGKIIYAHPGNFNEMERYNLYTDFKRIGYIEVDGELQLNGRIYDLRPPEETGRHPNTKWDIKDHLFSTVGNRCYLSNGFVSLYNSLDHFTMPLRSNYHDPIPSHSYMQRITSLLHWYQTTFPETVIPEKTTPTPDTFFDKYAPVVTSHEVLPKPEVVPTTSGGGKTKKRRKQRKNKKTRKKHRKSNRRWLR